MTADAAPHPPVLIAEVRNRIGHLVLNRPQALNALDLELLTALDTQLRAWQADDGVRAVVLRGAGGKAFCAGGDIRALYHAVRARQASPTEPDPMAFFHIEYPLDQLLHQYGKPYLAWLDGIVMGGGMGLAQGASLRVVTERSRLAMPETAIGYFPDVGGSFFLSRMPGALGEYLGLCGVPLLAADAVALGWADVALPSSLLDELLAALDTLAWPPQREGDPRQRQRDQATLARLLGSLAEATQQTGQSWPEAVVLSHRPWINAHFSQESVPAIQASLQAAAADHSDEAQAAWARDTLALFERHSPLAMAVTLEQIRRGRNLTLEQCFALETHLDAQWLERGDLLEGVRALLIDKDKTPHWQPDSHSAVSAGQVQSFFPHPETASKE
ncbi:enoyl-CoA hydratase/isomerase family protein [Amphibiibacter pelophylacis]|uniref:Enoyl-CoA hydratase/isomerase family protein n=1 Tax=Amphibiibacter pelophylacis TaxID=1799477 RepID=A0ACC6P0M5_9BURK